MVTYMFFTINTPMATFLQEMKVPTLILKEILQWHAERITACAKDIQTQITEEHY